MQNKKALDVLLYIVSAEVIGIVSALLAGNFSAFFIRYKAPPLLPVSWLFPVVWVILYALMGYCAYLVDSTLTDRKTANEALSVYWLQLAVNFSWSIVFFRLEALKLSVAVILLLLALIILMISLFRNINRLSALLNIPYLVWVLFASYLNIATTVING